MTPFWLLNDRLSLSELLRQVAAMDAAGVGGFVQHPRVGLPRDQGWMSDPLLGMYREVCAEAARRGLRVILYDERMYPSGSSSGRVVAADLRYRCRGWVSRETEALSEGETRVGSYVAGDGRRRWVVDRTIPSVIRGLHYRHQDDGGPESPTSNSEDTPPAADLLNPEAMACFLRVTHDVYAPHLREFFGSTINGIFTDEPSLLGRLTGEAKALGRIVPGTTGLLAEAERLTGVAFGSDLAALFEEDHPRASEVRRAWTRACRLRLEETYYGLMSACGVSSMGWS